MMKYITKSLTLFAMLISVILFFGLQSSTIAQSFSRSWTQLFPTGTPPTPRHANAYGYDDVNDRLIIYGGNDFSGLPFETDAWVLTNASGLGGTPSWVEITPTGIAPDDRQLFSGVYDPNSNRLIIHGGCGGNCSPALNDVWVLTNANGLGGVPSWIQLPSAPIGRATHMATYDKISNRMIVFGGHRAFSGTQRNDVWVLTDANGIGSPAWIQLSPAGTPPSARFRTAGVYDGTSNRMIVFGGRHTATDLLNDVWVLKDANGIGSPEWIQLSPVGTPPDPRGDHVMVYDPITNEAIVYGGVTDNGATFVNDTWILTHANGLGGVPEWIQLNPSAPLPVATFQTSVGYSPSSQRMILALGRNDQVSSRLFNDVWVLTGEALSQVVFFEDFNDGELNNNPTWDSILNDNYAIINGELHSDGLIQDQSDRYRNIYVSFVSIQAPDYLELSYHGLLKENGNPQTGRGTKVSLSSPGRNYQLNIQRGYVDGFPTNKFSLSLSAGLETTVIDLIVSDFQPEYDQMYTIRAVRQSGAWTLYADGTLIGTAADPLGVAEFKAVALQTVGSVVVDDIVVKVIPPVLNVDPSVTLTGSASANEGEIFSYSYTVSDPNNDTFTLDNETCGAGGILSNSTFDSATGAGSFDCTFPDGPTTTEVSVTVSDDNGGSGSDSLTVTVNNVAPSVTVDKATATVDEGHIANNTGTFSDPGDEIVSITASIGTIQQVGSQSGTWSWAFNTSDGPDQSQQVAIMATDSDGDSTTTTFQLTVNNVAPTIIAVTNDGPIGEGSSATVTVEATDPAADSDPLSYEFDCDNNGSYEIGPLLGNTTSCSFDDNGSFPVSVRVTDDDGGNVIASTMVTINNIAPTADFANTSSDILEGEAATLAFSDLFDPSTADTTAGFLYSYDCTNDGTFELTDASTTSFACDYPDNGSFTAKGRIKDKDGGFTDDTVEVIANNIAPQVGAITAPVDPAHVNTGIGVSALFTDPGLLDTHTAIWEWGDGSTSEGIVAETDGSGSVSGNHAYAEVGVYTIKLTVTDKDGGSGQSTFQYVVIYDPEGAFVTGGGWIDSPEGAYTADPSLTGKATFGFVSKYKKGADVPTGNTEFQFKVADLNFHSDSYDWLVVAGHKAQFKGTGTINGSGNYGFMLTAIDEELTPSTDVGLFRIKIWDKDDGDAVVYDNQVDCEAEGLEDDVDPCTAIVGGNIVIHKGK